MTSNHLKKVSVFILIIGILCTCLFGCTDKPASGNDVNSTTESTTKGEESTTIDTDDGNEEDSSVHKEKSPVKKDDETTTNKKTNVKESSTKKVDKETTTKGTTTTEPTTEAYTPKPLVPLTAEQELKIKEDYLEFYKVDVQKFENNENEYYRQLTLEEQERFREKYDLPENYVYQMTTEDVDIYKFFGKYNNCVAIFIDSILYDYNEMVWSENVAGCTFKYSSSRQISIYKNGEFTTLNIAYNKGWISKEDVKDIHYYYNCLL